MENLNSIISKNLIKYRTQAGYTQVTLAEKISYSDKSVSKWERGESLPDVSVLIKLAEIYGITLNDFVEEEKEPVIKQTKLLHNKKHLLIALISAGLVYVLAGIIFTVLFLFHDLKPYSWLVFIYAIPVSGIVLTVFSHMWGKTYAQILSASLIVWGIVLSICLSVRNSSIWTLCIVGGVAEIMVIMWFILIYYIKKIKKKNSKQKLDNEL